MSKEAALLACASAFGKRLTEDTIEVWMEDLGEYSSGIVEKAFSDARRSFERFPTISGLRALCGAETADQRRKQEAGKWLPPLVHTVEEKRRFLQHCASGERRAVVARSIQARGRAAWAVGMANAQRLLDTMTEADLEAATMPGLLLQIQPGWDSGVGRMPSP